MYTVLVVAVSVTFLVTIFTVLRYGNTACEGPLPVSILTFSAVLFTSGLDVGLIMFPLSEFDIFAKDNVYQFSNPLAIEFGMWGFLVWGFYFLTTCYFCLLEPRVKIFEIPLIKYTYNLVVVATCAFTAYLLLHYLPFYVEGISALAKYSITCAVVLLAVLSSTDVKYVKSLSIGSTWLFFSLAVFMWIFADMGISGLQQNVFLLGDYFVNIQRFVFPISDHHQFYLFWWFAWSIMIGQFVSRFANGIKAWKLLLAMLIIPSIPIALWFSIIYYYYQNSLQTGGFIALFMVIVGVIFVINSLDSLIRLYTENFNLSTKNVEKRYYIAGNWLALILLVLLFQLTPLKMEFVGLIVTALYAVVFVYIFKRRDLLVGNKSEKSGG